MYHLTVEHKDHLQKIAKGLQRSLDKLYLSIKSSAKLGYGILAKENSQYLKSFKFIVSSSWFYERHLLRKPISLEQLSRFEVEIKRRDKDDSGGDTLNEQFSDKCMKDLMGTSGKPKCTVADDCWKVMNSFGHTGYTITHQSLFFILADVIG